MIYTIQEIMQVIAEKCRYDVLVIPFPDDITSARFNRLRSNVPRYAKLREMSLGHSMLLY
jgi:hypothetical protein